MKLPRWLVIAMQTSSVLVVLAGILAAGWCWATWPERTAREFQGRLVERNWDDAAAMLLDRGPDYPPCTVMAWLAGSRQDEFTLEPQPWTWEDLYRGSRHFKLGEERVVWFIAEKGRITEWNTWSSARYQLPLPMGYGMQSRAIGPRD